MFRFVKSSHSSPIGGECVEVATNVPSVVAVRDSKNPSGRTLLFGDREWLAFRAAVADGQIRAEDSAV
ncbi:toxin [Streptomyces paromomycinus]|uniref:Toxin n=1 Tax=Streptomyces paromomycinus TaxID=92743 RepID=A0A401W5A4_STREY|nr:toxin [Streptomyces paromomycinus]